MIIASTDIIRGSHNYGDTMTSYDINEAVDFIQNSDMNNLNCNITRKDSVIILTSLYDNCTDTGTIRCETEEQAVVIYEILNCMNIHNV